MKKILSAVMLAILGSSAFAGATVDRIISTKTLNVGARANSIPYSFQDSNGRFQGYSQDFVNEVKKDFEKKYGVSLTVAKQEVTAQTRQILVTSGAIDIEGGSTTATESRSKVVNFAILDADPVVPATLSSVNLRSLDDLKGKRVGVVAGTTAQALLQKLNTEKGWSTTIVGVKDYPAGFALLEQGRVDAVATNGVLLSGEIAKAGGKKFKLQPQVIIGEAELIGVMFAKDDPEFTALVHSTMARMKADGSLERLYGKWFSQPIPSIGNLNMQWTPAQKKQVFESK